MVTLADLPQQQHSLQQVAWLESKLKSGRMGQRDAFFVASEMVCHGFDAADKFIDMLAGQTKREDAARFLANLKQKNARLRSWPFRGQVLGNADLRDKLYELDTHIALKGSRHPDKALIVHTTMYNNFGISTPLLVSGLLELGVSIVILKDSSLFNYLKGANSIGKRLDDISNYIREVQDQLEAKDLYFASYSSGSFASLYAAIMLDGRGYLGFSPITDRSDRGLPPAKFFTPEIRDEVDPRYLINLRELYEAMGCTFPGTLYYGANAFIDRAHARDMALLDTFSAIEIENCAHATVDHLILRGEFLGAFRKLLEL